MEFFGTITAHLFILMELGCLINQPGATLDSLWKHTPSHSLPGTQQAGEKYDSFFSLCAAPGTQVQACSSPPSQLNSLELFHKRQQPWGIVHKERALNWHFWPDEKILLFLGAYLSGDYCEGLLAGRAACLGRGNQTV